MLNEYIKEKKLWNTVKEIDDDFFVNNYNNWDWYLCEQVMSKNFWFIERLVENDYINMDRVERDATSYFTDESPVYWNEIWTARLIMMLSVSNFPIKDLIYYLGKEDEHYIKPWWYKLVFNDKKL